MAFYFERDSFYHIYKDCPDVDTNLKEEKIVGTGEKEVCLKCAERKKVEFLKRKELDNKKEKQAQREKNKRHSKGVWKKKY